MRRIDHLVTNMDTRSPSPSRTGKRRIMSPRDYEPPTKSPASLVSGSDPHGMQQFDFSSPRESDRGTWSPCDGRDDNWGCSPLMSPVLRRPVKKAIRRSPASRAGSRDSRSVSPASRPGSPWVTEAGPESDDLQPKLKRLAHSSWEAGFNTVDTGHKTNKTEIRLPEINESLHALSVNQDDAPSDSLSHESDVINNESKPAHIKGGCAGNRYNMTSPRHVTELMGDYISFRAARRRSSCKEITFHFLQQNHQSVEVTPLSHESTPIFNTLQSEKSFSDSNQVSLPNHEQEAPLETGYDVMSEMRDMTTYSSSSNTSSLCSTPRRRLLLPRSRDIQVTSPLSRSLSMDGYGIADLRGWRQEAQAFLFDSTPDLSDDASYFPSVRSHRRGAVCYTDKPILLLEKLHLEDSDAEDVFESQLVTSTTHAMGAII